MILLLLKIVTSIFNMIITAVGTVHACTCIYLYMYMYLYMYIYHAYIHSHFPKLLKY